jgi:RNA polymerase-binding transcription factor DksA
MISTDTARRRLLARREELAQRSALAAADLRHEREPLSADFADQVTQRENEDVLRGLDLSARAGLQEVNQALERLAHGQYFDCMRCGAAIEPARHEALPEAVLCARCAAAGA